MMSKKTRLWLGALAAVAVALLGSPAQGKLWTATYDPDAYVGTGTFDVSDACLANDGPHQQGDFALCTIRILGNISTMPAVDFISILNDPFGIPLCNSCEYEVLGGKFAGVNTGIIGSVNLNDIDDYWFEFISSYDFGNNENIPPSVSNTVNLYKNNCGPNSDDFLVCGDPAFAAPGPNGFVTFAVVPEPGSLALIVGALGAGWIVRRRKTAD